jgi:hypothetical protein
MRVLKFGLMKNKFVRLKLNKLMKKLLLSLVFSLGVLTALANPTIKVPLLLVDNEASLPQKNDNNYHFSLKQSVIKISRQVNGALILSGKFTIINTPDKTDKIVYVDNNDDSSNDTSDKEDASDGTRLFALAADTNSATPISNAGEVKTKTKDTIEYYLIGVLDSIDVSNDNYALKDTSNSSYKTTIDINVSYKLIRTVDKVVIASFASSGSATAVKILPTESKVQPISFNYNKLFNAAVKDLSSDVVDQMLMQFNLFTKNAAKAQQASGAKIVTDVTVYK